VRHPALQASCGFLLSQGAQAAEARLRELVTETVRKMWLRVENMKKNRLGNTNDVAIQMTKIADEERIALEQRGVSALEDFATQQLR
jgi:hypothetical protein